MKFNAFAKTAGLVGTAVIIGSTLGCSLLDDQKFLSVPTAEQQSHELSLAYDIAQNKKSIQAIRIGNLDVIYTLNKGGPSSVVEQQATMNSHILVAAEKSISQTSPDVVQNDPRALADTIRKNLEQMYSENVASVVIEEVSLKDLCVVSKKDTCTNVTAKLSADAVKEKRPAPTVSVVALAKKGM